MIDELSGSTQAKEGEQVKDQKDDPTSNQTGNPMGLAEQGARNGMNEGNI